MAAELGQDQKLLVSCLTAYCKLFEAFLRKTFNANCLTVTCINMEDRYKFLFKTILI